MYYRSVLFFSFFLLSLSFFTSQTEAASLTQQRTYYDIVKKSLARGDSSTYYRYENQLNDYPLKPYLTYDELSLRLKTASNTEIERFLKNHGDLPQIRWMKLRWLRSLANNSDWDRFEQYYNSNIGFAELDCLHAAHLLNQNDKKTGYQLAHKLWLTGDSQPTSCDVLFDRWASAGLLTDDLKWDRLKLALKKNNYSLARYLVNSWPASPLKSQGQLLITVAKDPQILSQTQRFTSSSRQMLETVGLGLQKLALKSPEQTAILLDIYAKKLSFKEKDTIDIARKLGPSLARQSNPLALSIMETYDPNGKNETLTEWKIRLLLQQNKWAQVNQLIQKMPPEDAEENRWRYWQARSLEKMQPTSVEAQTLYKKLAKERDFYGFMAADRIKTAYNLKNQPLIIDSDLMKEVRNTPGIIRAIEFYDRGEVAKGRREWYYASSHFQREEILAQAQIAYSMGWYFPAIRGVSQAKYWDDLNIRFPIAHKNALTSMANKRLIPVTWAFAITRQESAFMSDARSPSGAMGLMQLMPATAKETAQRYNINIPSSRRAYRPDINIQLGTAYLHQIYNQFDDNRILASAAYNAGPGRVRQWQRNTKHVKYDIWIENIPFNETRKYVQNILTYAVIYGHKLNRSQKLVTPNEARIYY